MAFDVTNTATMLRVSTAANGTQGNGASLIAAFAPDGRRVIFRSDASNLVAGDGNGRTDLFIKDLMTGALTRVSTTTTGAEANGDSYTDYGYGPFSPDGNAIVFSSNATNLLAGDSNGVNDVYLKNLTTGDLMRVSTTAGGAQANGQSYMAGFAADGNRVVFTSAASNLAANDVNGVDDIFVKTLSSGAIARVSEAADGTPGNGASITARFSPDGTRVVFASDANNLIPGDVNGFDDIFVKTLATGAMARVSTTAAGGQALGDSFSPVFSADGAQVLFLSNAANLVDGDSNGAMDVFLKNLTTGAISRVSTDAAGGQGNGHSIHASFSPDGTMVIFASDATNLVPGDTNGVRDIFVKTLATGAITRVSAPAGGGQANGTSGGYTTAFSPDGTFILMGSEATNLVAGDSNAVADVFAKSIMPPAMALSLAAADAEHAEDGGGFTFTVTRSGNTLGSASASWAVAGTGLRPADVADFTGGVLPSGTVSFGPLETAKTITVPVAADAAVETHEDFAVTLSAPSADTSLGSATAAGRILADDAIFDLIAINGDTSLSVSPVPQFYQGPTGALTKEWITNSSENLTCAVSGPGWFIHTGSGNDAISVASGTNVLDGGTGSNFLTGGTGPDTFFVDARNPPSPIWSTVVGFGAGDATTMWGINDVDFALKWENNEGAPGFRGLTLHAMAPGVPTASLTLAGYSMADKDSGLVIPAFGFDSASNSHYLYIAHA